MCSGQLAGAWGHEQHHTEAQTGCQLAGCLNILFWNIVRYAFLSGVFFSGAIGQLDLVRQAITSSIDLGRIKMVADRSQTVGQLLGELSPIVINMMGACEDLGLQRADKDAQVAVAAFCS